jgi:hypothetical protein
MALEKALYAGQQTFFSIVTKLHFGINEYSADCALVHILVHMDFE